MQWYFVKDGHQQGPVDKETLAAMIRSGEICATDLVWNPEQSDLWQPVSSLLVLLKSQAQKVAAIPVRFDQLTTRSESVYLKWVVAWSVLAWLAALIIVPFILIFALFAWLANGLLVASLRADSVEVSRTQMPELYNTFLDVCRRLHLKEAPALYVVQSNGALNAFTTKHCGRNFVVICSDLLEAYGNDSAEVKFLLGHEIGHIKRNHILKHILFIPGMSVPLLSPAYSRACETSCDRFGAYASNDVHASMTALMVLSGGTAAKQTMNADAFAAQYYANRGFFVSWHELISGYPTLSRRMAAIKAVGKGSELESAHRHPLAYVFALASPAPLGGGSISPLIAAAIIMLLAAVELPLFVKTRDAVRKNVCSMNLRAIDACKQKASVKYDIGMGNMVPTDKLLEFSPKGSSILKCPGRGGVYIMQPLGVSELCQVHGVPTFSLPQQDNGTPQSADQRRRDSCISNLWLIEHAKQQAATASTMKDSKVPAWAELVPYFKGQKLACPEGGAYSINAITSYPTCSKGPSLGHALGL